MKISVKGINFIKNEEKFMAKPYLDPVGVATIGFGTIRYNDGTKVRLTDKPITEAKATELLNFQINQDYAPAVLKAIKRPLNQNQFDALVSFAYNVGAAGMAGSTLIKKINAGITDAKTIYKWFGVWNKGTINGNKVELLGLTKRRKREANLFLS